jgi:Mrp family chromosome partitioning ATPase
VVVLRWNATKATEAQRLYEELARAHAPIVGTVLNRTDINAPEFRYYRRHHDYYAAAA